VIDFVALLLINTMAGYVLLAWYVYAGIDDPDQRKWAPGFVVAGLVALLFGGYLALTWPLPGSYNSAYGEMSVLFGVLLLSAGVVMARGGSLLTLAVYGFFAGLVAVELGIRFVVLGLSQSPLLTGLGFVVSGMGGMLAAPGLFWFKKSRVLRVLVAILLLGAACTWAVVGYGAYWMHMKAFMDLGVHGLPSPK